jgi:hypothetical protein
MTTKDNYEIFQEVFANEDDDVAEQAWNELRASSGVSNDEFRKLAEITLELFHEDE